MESDLQIFIAVKTCDRKNVDRLSIIAFHFKSQCHVSNLKMFFSLMLSQKKEKIRLKTKEINLLIRKRSHLSVENKLLIYKVVIKPIWSYGRELWGCASKSNIFIMQRSQSKVLKAIANSPCYVTNHTINTDFNIPQLSDVFHERINKQHNNLEAHPNPLLEPLKQPINTRRLKRCWSLDLQGT